MDVQGVGKDLSVTLSAGSTTDLDVVIRGEDRADDADVAATVGVDDLAANANLHRAGRCHASSQGKAH